MHSARFTPVVRTSFRVEERELTIHTCLVMNGLANRIRFQQRCGQVLIYNHFKPTQLDLCRQHAANGARPQQNEQSWKL